MEAGLAGRPVDAEFAEFAELAADLKAGRPKPDEVFAADLDRAVADGFPPEWSEDPSRRPGRGFFGRIAERFGGRCGALAPSGHGSRGASVVVVAAGIDFGDGRSGQGVDGAADSSAVQSPTADSAASAESAPKRSRRTPAIPSSQGRLAIPTQAGSAAGERQGGLRREDHPGDPSGGTSRTPATGSSRWPDSYNGIVKEFFGQDDQRRGRLHAYDPERQAEAAVADLSGLADLRGRSQQAVDITAPTLSTRDRLRTARARVESLLVELAGSETEEARIIVERQLRNARRNVSFLSTRLERLERQVSLTPVNVVVEADEGSGSGVSGWDLGDAIDDAGNLLAISAGVALIAFAIAIPIGLMVLVALAINRAWQRRSRDRVLKDS